MKDGAVFDYVVSVTRAAVSGGLLFDADSLATGIEAAGWARATEIGHWHCPDEPSWSLWSSNHPPNLAVFYSDKDASTVLIAGQELAQHLDQDGNMHRRGSALNWPAWLQNDPHWDEWTGLEADWVIWDGGPAQISLDVRPVRQPGAVLLPPRLHLQVERIGTH
jgi:hypothetical protein